MTSVLHFFLASQEQNRYIWMIIHQTNNSNKPRIQQSNDTKFEWSHVDAILERSKLGPTTSILVLIRFDVCYEDGME